MMVHSMRLSLVGALAVILSVAAIAQEPAKEPPNAVDQRLETAFGAGSKEMQRPVKAWLAERKLVLAAGEVSVVDKNQIRIVSFSAALFSADGKVIQTIRGESAVITVDGAVNGLSDLGTRKITGITVNVGGGLEMPFAVEPAPAKRPESLKQAVADIFGRDSPEVQRPVRLRIAGETMLIVAEKAHMAKDGRSVRFEKASLAMSSQSIDVFRGEEVLVTAVNPVGEWGDLWTRQIDAVEVRSKDTAVRIIPGPQILKAFSGSGGGFGAPGGFGGGFGGGSGGQGFGAPGGGSGEKKEATNAPALPPIEAIVESGSSLVALAPAGIRFHFKIDPKTPLADLLPTPPKAAKVPDWRNEDLAKVPELAIAQPVAKELPKTKAMQMTAHAIAKINHLNRTKTDGFLLAMLDQRSDLRGLPFLMGDECRTREQQAKIFALVADGINRSLSATKVTKSIGIDPVTNATKRNPLTRCGQASLRKSRRSHRRNHHAEMLCLPTRTRLTAPSSLL